MSKTTHSAGGQSGTPDDSGGPSGFGRRLTPAEIVGTTFPTVVVGGYARGPVNTFHQRALLEIRRLLADQSSLLNDLRVAQERLAHYESVFALNSDVHRGKLLREWEEQARSAAAERQAIDAIAGAQRQADGYVAQAQQVYQAWLEQARERYRAIIQEAAARAQAIAEQAAVATSSVSVSPGGTINVSAAIADVAQLQQHAETLRTCAEVLAGNLGSVLNALSEGLAERSSLPPAPPLALTRPTAPATASPR